MGDWVKKLTQKRKAARARRYDKRFKSGLSRWFALSSVQYHFGNLLMWDINRTDPLFDPKNKFIGPSDDCVIQILE